MQIIYKLFSKLTDLDARRAERSTAGRSYLAAVDLCMINGLKGSMKKEVKCRNGDGATMGGNEDKRD